MEGGGGGGGRCDTALRGIMVLIISFLDFMSRIAVIWISSPELSYV